MCFCLLLMPILGKGVKSRLCKLILNCTHVHIKSPAGWLIQLSQRLADGSAIKS
uniref:Uncharacterized protein n=1 Tax=Anguilla anguilla TaxID=7936 RepID=A0A0E9QIM5_ANGAN